MRKIKSARIVNMDPSFTEEYFTGVRFDDRDFKIGDTVPCSYDWTKTENLPREDWESARYDGTCAIRVDVRWDDEDEVAEHLLDQLRQSDAGGYYYVHAYLVTGTGEDDDAVPNDDGEVVLTDMMVVGEIELTYED